MGSAPAEPGPRGGGDAGAGAGVGMGARVVRWGLQGGEEAQGHRRPRVGVDPPRGPHPSNGDLSGPSAGGGVSAFAHGCPARRRTCGGTRAGAAGSPGSRSQQVGGRVSGPSVSGRSAGGLGRPDGCVPGLCCRCGSWVSLGAEGRPETAGVTVGRSNAMMLTPGQRRRICCGHHRAGACSPEPQPGSDNSCRPRARSGSRRG